MATPKKLSKAEARAIEEAKVVDYFKVRALEELGRQEKGTNRSISLAAARGQLFLEQFKEMAEVVFKNKITASGYATKKPSKNKKRILNLLLSDLHIGARLDAREVPNGFGPNEEARRLAHVVLNTAEYKTDHRNDTELNVYLDGDVIEGLLLHDMRSGAPLVEQCVAFMEYMMQALTFLAKAFPSVRVYCQTGNHGRNKLIHPGRATFQKYDSTEGILYHSLRIACRPLKNVSFDIPMTPYCAVPLFNHMALVTHGDTIVNFGNPGKSVDVKGIETQISKINSTEVYGHRFSVVAGGHVHTGCHIQLAEAHIIINPALIPSNGYALDLGYVSACGQRIWESTENYPVGDMRLIEVGPAQDKDASLDKIITPFSF